LTKMQATAAHFDQDCSGCNRVNCYISTVTAEADFEK
jgi:hypothetical protein